VHDCQQSDGARCWSRLVAGRRFQRLELAPGSAVNDVPPTRAKPLADGIGALEVLVPPELNALGEQALCFLWV